MLRRLAIGNPCYKIIRPLYGLVAGLKNRQIVLCRIVADIPIRALDHFGWPALAAPMGKQPCASLVDERQVQFRLRTDQLEVDQVVR